MNRNLPIGYKKRSSLAVPNNLESGLPGPGTRLSVFCGWKNTRITGITAGVLDIPKVLFVVILLLLVAAVAEYGLAMFHSLGVGAWLTLLAGATLGLQAVGLLEKKDAPSS